MPLKQIVLSAFALLLASPLSAAEGPDTNYLGRDPALEKSPGAAVYRENCAACHDAGLNRAPQRATVGEMTPEAIHRALTTGAMREQGSALSEPQRIAVAEYVSGRKFGMSRAPGSLNMCDADRARMDLSEPSPFTGWGLDPGNTHSIPARVSGLNRANAGRLRLKWAFGAPNSARMRSHPTVAGGAILVGSQNGFVYALDRETGCVRWAFEADAEVRTGIVVSPWRRGDRRARPLAYFGDTSGNVYGVNLLDGTLAWKTRADNHPAAIITGTPTLWKNELYVPISSVEEAFAASQGYECCTFRGAIVALDPRTGETHGRDYLVGEPRPQGTTPSGVAKFGPSGVAVWNSPMIDRKRGHLVFATGDNYSHPATAYSDAIVTMDLGTRVQRWHYQALEGDTWNVGCVMGAKENCPEGDSPDFDFGAGTVLARGRDGREYILAGQKSGWVYALDPVSGRLVWKTRVGRGSPGGGVHFGMAAENGLLFVPVTDNYHFGPADFPASPGLHALDVATGAIVWKRPSQVTSCPTMVCNPGFGGVPTATGGLVLAGDDQGVMRVLDAANGQVLWQDDTARDFPTVNGVKAHGGAISGGVAPIAYKGNLIVASGYGFASKKPGNVLLVYEAE